MENLNLFIVLLGGYNEHDLIESHNLFICVGSELSSLLPQMKKSWPGVTHVDGYMIVKHVNGYDIQITEGSPAENKFPMLVVANIGYYKAGQFSEFHKLIPFVLTSERDSISEKLKQDPDFLEGQNLENSTRSHLDDKHIVTAFDVDDVINVHKKIPAYKLELKPSDKKTKNELIMGYKFTELKNM